MHLFRKEVIKLRFRVEVLFEPEHPLVIYQVTYLAFRVEEVPEFPCPCGACLHTGRIPAVSYTLHTKRTLIDNVLIARPVAEIMDGSIQFVFLYFGFRPVKGPASVRACGHAIPAADTPVIVDDYEAIGFLPGGVYWANFDTRRIFAVLTLDRHVEVILFRYLWRIIVMFRLFHVYEVTLLQSEDPDPLYLRVVARTIVFLHARIDTSPASHTAREVKTVSPKGIWLRPLCTDTEIFAVF